MTIVVGEMAFAVVLPSDVALFVAGSGEVAGLAAIGFPTTSVTPPVRPLTATDVRALVPAYCNFAVDGVCVVTTYWHASESVRVGCAEHDARCPAVTDATATDMVIVPLAKSWDALTV
jgi:hypothetical protein